MFSLLPNHTDAKDVIIFVPSDLGSKNITEDFYVFDENKPLNINQIINEEANFKLTTTKVPAFFANNKGHWIKLNILSDKNQTIYFDLGTLSFDALDLYTVDSNNNIKTHPHLNWKVPIAKRAGSSEFYTYKIHLKPNEIVKVFIRGLNAKGTFRMPMRMSSEIGFNTVLKEYNLFYGVLFGVTLLIFCLGMSFYFLSKDISYLYYVLSLTSIITQSTILNGYVYDSFLKLIPSLADPTFGNLFITTFVLFHVAFLREILLDKVKTPEYIYKFSIYLGRLSLVLAVVMICCLIDNRLFYYMAYLVYVVYLGLLINLILNLRQGFRYNKQNALFILVSNTPFCIYLLYLILTNLRVIKQNSPYNIVMWCIIFDNIILCIGLAFRFNFVSKKELLLQKKIYNQKLKNLEIDKIRQEEKISLLEAQFKLKDERERISRDLHDNIGSQLAYITSNLDYFSNNLEDKRIEKNKLNELSDYARFTTQQLRDTIWAINKEQVLVSEFVKRTQAYILKHTEHLKNCSFEVNYKEAKSINNKLGSSQTLNLFRILQEATHNILKHSNADTISLSVVETDKKLLINLKDNGVGFVLTEKSLESYGLENMITRIKDINGDLTIDTDLGKGTEIKIWCPL